MRAISLRRWLRRGPPRHYRGPEVPALLGRLGSLLEAGKVGGVEEWAEQPALAETYWYPTKPRATERMVPEAAALLSGRFRPANRFPRQELGFPPPWGADPFDDDNWQSNLHGLEWLIPLVHAHAGEPGGGYLEAAARTIADWIEGNPFRGSPSRFSWHDHASAKRLRLFAWFWEQYRKSDGLEEGFARLLLASVYQHALYHMDGRNYREDSNHGLEAIGALLAAGITFSMFREAEGWTEVAFGRLEQWLKDNLSPEGFHLEQSPAYHWFVLLRLAAIDRFLRANRRPVSYLAEATERAAEVWPYLLKPDGTVPSVGDSSRAAPKDWRGYLSRRWARPVPEASGSGAGGERRGGFVVSPRAGYAIFSGGDSKERQGGPETHVLFRCRAFSSPHFHNDALSFVLYGLGRDWIVDPGYLNYHESDPRRRYLRSPRAHSGVVDEVRDARVHASECLEWGRAEEGDFVVATHDLPEGRHTRRLVFVSPRRLVIRDEISPARPGGVKWSQLFQVAPGLEVEVKSEREAHLVSPEGARCVVEQSAAGEWQVVRGQEKPRLQGWYSAGYGEWEASATLFFRPSAETLELESRVRLEPAPSEELSP